MNAKTVLIIASLSGALSVAIGAFGAHGLRPILEASGRMDTFETAVRYQFYHTIALLICGLLLKNTELAVFQFAAWLFMAGILVFSGSLFILCITGIRWLGAITPIGGLAFIAGWVLLAWGIAKSQ